MMKMNWDILESTVSIAAAALAPIALVVMVMRLL
jgi:hypothetical protein